MSRIGKLPISIPEKVTVTVSDDNTITVKGPKGELSQKIDPSIEVVIENGVITFQYAGGKTVAEATKQEHAYHGLYRALVNNMVIGVSAGFTKELELVGVGYRVSEKPNNAIELLLGFTHPIYMQFPAEVKVTTKSERNKNPLITLESCNKELLGLICAKIRSFRKPEPYKGKGVKFVGEVIRRKSGKSAGAK
ncbi:MAG: 50S ribosomal protein L6 [Bacteroidaceae bacterium]|nr:50S ribosomal protein L6 [Bacteroidaceae bacterium]MBR5865869.1 50S ribosomal protein L6 [Alistipes sp.]